jgi:hypothetical protein
MVYALAATTEIMDYNFCDVYRLCSSVLADNELKQDIRIQAINMIMDYINLYKDDCNE